MKTRVHIALTCMVGFIAGCWCATIVRKARHAAVWNEAYKRGRAIGAEEVRREAVAEGHASYFDRDGDMRSEFRWNTGRPEWTGGAEGMGSTGELPPFVVSLLK